MFKMKEKRNTFLIWKRAVKKVVDGERVTSLVKRVSVAYQIRSLT
ncbi:MAG: hypothetical protein ACTSYD_13985 [Candidatus Heimdallarchaeaceae archaeon]